MVNKTSGLLLSVLFLFSFASAIGVNLGSDVNINSKIDVANSGSSTIVTLSNGENVTISVNSNAAEQAAITKLNIQGSCSDCKVELTQVNVNGELRAAYNVETVKVVKVFWIFKSNMKVSANVDAQTGQVISVEKPWWAAISSESSADVSSDNSENDNDGNQVNVVVNNSNTVSGNRPLSEWCIKGQTYSVSQNGSASSTVIEGIATYKGSQWCKGTSKTTIKVPGGYSADIEALTTYYFNEGGKEMWISTNVNGQVTEVHVTNN